MSLDIRVVLDADATLNFLGALPAQLDEALDRGLKRAAFLIESGAKQYAPVDTGRLRASIHTITRHLYAEVGTNVDYAVFVHEGTRFMRAQPFFREAISELSG